MSDQKRLDVLSMAFTGLVLAYATCFPTSGSAPTSAVDRNSAGDPIASVDGGTVGWSIHAVITHCISTRRHLGDYHHGYTNFGACLLARLGMGIGRAGTWLDDSCASYGYGYPAYSYASYGYPGYGYGGGYYRPAYRSAYYGGRVACGTVAIARTRVAVSGAIAIGIGRIVSVSRAAPASPRRGSPVYLHRTYRSRRRMRFLLRLGERALLASPTAMKFGCERCRWRLRGPARGYC